MPSSPPANLTTVRRRLTVERRTRLVAIGLIVAGVGAGLYAVMRTPPLPLPTNQGAATSAGDLYTDLFEASYRPDEGRGTVALASVYYYPLLQDALDRFTQASAHQQELRAILRQVGANSQTLAFYLLVDSLGTQGDLDLSRAELTDRAGRRYPFEAWTRFNSYLPQEANQTRTASVLTFDSTAEDGTRFPGDEAEELTLTIRGLPEPAERSFSWLLRVLPRS